MLELIQDLYRHMEWADALDWRTVAAFAPAREDGDLRERFFHIHAVQQIWLARWQGLEFTPPKATDYASFEDLRHYARACHVALKAYLGLRKDADLAEPLAYRNLAGEAFTQPLGELLLHLAYHSHYHRAQIATRLRALGTTPPDTDLVIWHRTGRPAPGWE
ncbi:MAG TPA: DinB family protein [Holophagaceae bacterium]|nr:DinB family protein [Holophagaceae bacterium]